MKYFLVFEVFIDPVLWCLRYGLVLLALPGGNSQCLSLPLPLFVELVGIIFFFIQDYTPLANLVEMAKVKEY